MYILFVQKGKRRPSVDIYIGLIAGGQFFPCNAKVWSEVFRTQK